MKAIELIGDIDEQHRLHAQVPTEIPAGQVRLIVFLPGEDEAGGLWADGVALEWSAELSDSREDIYTRRRPAGECDPVRSIWRAFPSATCQG